MAYALSDYTKIIDLGLPWRSLTTSAVGYPSDSWASCNYLLAAFIGFEFCCKSVLLHASAPQNII